MPALTPAARRFLILTALFCAFGVAVIAAAVIAAAGHQGDVLAVGSV